MDRVLQNTSATIYGRFYLDGTATDPTPDTATVDIVRADGTVLVNDGAATNVAGGSNAGLFSYQLTSAETSLLERFTVRWTSNLGTITTYVEVVGGFLFSLAQARAVKPLDDATKYPTATLVESRVLVEQSLEDACSVAFVPRYERERLTATNPFRTLNLPVKWPKVRAIRDATVDGTALSAAQLLQVVPSGSHFYYPNYWTSSSLASDITIGYEHGYDFVPARVSAAALLLLKNWLVRGPVDDRTTSFSTEDGTFSLATPGMRGVTFGIPEVDAVVNEYSFSHTVG